jgi:hypothetical protein
VADIPPARKHTSAEPYSLVPDFPFERPSDAPFDCFWEVLSGPLWVVAAVPRCDELELWEVSEKRVPGDWVVDPFTSFSGASRNSRFGKFSNPCLGGVDDAVLTNAASSGSPGSACLGADGKSFLGSSANTRFVDCGT